MIGKSYRLGTGLAYILYCVFYYLFIFNIRVGAVVVGTATRSGFGSAPHFDNGFYNIVIENL
jgi:hypothetical protein